ncbi:MAG: peptidoglycan-binding protein [Patescibacteria group bacterium]|nr:peptidoglycan-binding protein [Patescibacteria group bacterium]
MRRKNFVIDALAVLSLSLASFICLSIVVAHPVEAATTWYINSSTGSDTTGNGTSGSPYRSFTKAYSSAAAGDTIDMTGTFTLTDSVETSVTTPAGFTIGKNLTIVGQGADQTIVQAATASTSAQTRVFTISSGVTATIKGLNIRNGRPKVGYGYYGGAIQNNGTLYVTADEIDNNISDNGGAGIDNLDVLYVASSTIDHNLCNGSTGMGCGVLSDYYIVSGGYTTITDSTIAWNTITATTGYLSGAGVHFRNGSGTITNSTITKNESCESAVGMDTSTGILTIKNTIIADNLYHTGSYCTSGIPIDFAYRSSGQGNVVDNGDNIVGMSDFYTWAGSGDWTDTNHDGTFDLQASTTTGTPNLSSTLSLNGTNDGVPTISLSAGSIAINNGGTGTNGATSTVPAFDERGAARVGTTDIGAYEYGGTITDTEPPVVSLTEPVANESTSSMVTIAASATDNTAVAGVTFYIDGAKQGSEVTSAPYQISWDSSATTTGTHTAYAVARDSSNNYATSSTVSFLVDSASLSISNIAVATTSATATITWTTSTTTSSRIFFGVSSAYGSSTAEEDTATRVTSHSLVLSELKPCAEYHYEIYGKDGMVNSIYSPDETFFTSGCTGSAGIISSAVATIATSTGGTLSSGRLTLTVPAAFTTSSSSLIFQADEIDATAFSSAAGTPSGETLAGQIFHLLAFSDATTTVSSFAQALTVKLSYAAGDVSGLDTSTLAIYRYDSGTWTALSSCSTDTVGMTVSCTTTGFSDFAIFGQKASSGSNASDSSTAPESFSSGGSVVGQYENLIAMGFTDQAQALKAQYAYLFPDSSPTPISPLAPAIPVAASASTTGFTRFLEEGMRGGDVRQLQRFLNAKGFMLATDGPGSPGNETDFFGSLTKAALIKFQDAHRADILEPAGLTEGTGIFGRFTLSEVARQP